jgi:hypothetical protein
MITNQQPAPTFVGHPSLYGIRLGTARPCVLRMPAGGLVTVWPQFRNTCVAVYQARNGVVCGAHASERSASDYVTARVAEGYVDITPTTPETV